MQRKTELQHREYKNKILNFFENIFVLKNLYRQGWVKYWNVDENKCESVGDHIFSMSVMSYIFAKEYRPDLDADKVLRIAMFHDLPEAIMGDIPAMDNYPKEKKQELENEALKTLFAGLKNEEHFKNLCTEYVDNKSEEVKFVKQIDKIEFLIQSFFYQNHGIGKMDFERFEKYANEWIIDKEVKDILEEIRNYKT